MVLKSGYVALALKLQEAVTKSPDKFKAKLEAALAAETEDGPWKSFLEAGARHSASDMGHLQAIHDASMVLGATCGSGMEEAAKPVVGPLVLVESASTLETIVLKEARADYEIKLIAPGKGSSAFYPSEVLKRDGPKVFGAGTHVYVNHPTRQEEAARPEGDVKNLAGVLTTAAVYHESHPKGEGLYARMKVFADHGTMVEEKAAHVGMSIRASGIAEASRKHEGLPVLKELVAAESVDVVTKAGAGGMILTEAAKPAATQTQEAGMTADDVKKLVEAELRTARLPNDARQEATRLLETVNLKPETKAFVIDAVLRGALPVKEGALDTDEFGKLIVAEAQRVGKILTAESGSGQVRGMGLPFMMPEAVKPEVIAAREAQAKREVDDEIAVFESLGMTPRAAQFAAKGRVA